MKFTIEDVKSIATKLVNGTKEILEAGNEIVPFAFIGHGQDITPFPLLTDSEKEKDATAAALREICKQTKPDFLIIIMDSWITNINAKDYAEHGFVSAEAYVQYALDNYKTHKDEAFNIIKRKEALTVVIENKSTSTAFAIPYKKTEEGIIWEEIQEMPNNAEGRFCNFIEKESSN